MRKLIVSIDNYDWIKYCSAFIMRNSNNCEVVIIRSQDEDSIVGYPKLCKEAVYEQRRDDLAKIGRKLGLQKLRNLRYPKELNTEDIEKLIMELQLNMIFGAVTEVYFSFNKDLIDIMQALENQLKHIKFYSYGKRVLSYNSVERVELTSEEIEIKRSLTDLMMGISTSEDLNFPVLTERFFYKSKGAK